MYNTELPIFWKERKFGHGYEFKFTPYIGYYMTLISRSTLFAIQMRKLAVFSQHFCRLKL